MCSCTIATLFDDFDEVSAGCTWPRDQSPNIAPGAAILTPILNFSTPILDLSPNIGPEKSKIAKKQYAICNLQPSNIAKRNVQYATCELRVHETIKRAILDFKTAIPQKSNPGPHLGVTNPVQ